MNPIKLILNTKDACLHCIMWVKVLQEVCILGSGESSEKNGALGPFSKERDPSTSPLLNLGIIFKSDKGVG